MCMMNGYIFGECDLSYCEFCECYDDCMSVGYSIPLEISMYEDTDTEPVTEQTQPIKFSKAQYRLLCILIRQKHISKDFFYRLLVLLYGTENWKCLDYDRMYRFFDFLKHSDKLQSLGLNIGF